MSCYKLDKNNIPYFKLCINKDSEQQLPFFSYSLIRST